MPNKQKLKQPLNTGKKPSEQQRFANQPGQSGSRNPSSPNTQKSGINKDAHIKNDPSKGREGRDTSW